MNSSIKNIIFDLGGVILNIDYSLCEKAFTKFGVHDFKNIYSQKGQLDLFDDFETGKISAGEFRTRLKKLIPQKVSDEQFDEAWDAMLLDLPKERVELLQKLKKQYRTFLLSNTNEIHIKWVSDHLFRTFGFKIFNSLFEKVYFSYEMGMRKPNAEIFELVLKENKLKKDETLFIDDSIQHIESAKQIGIKTLFLEKGKTILDLFT
ncbi:MAG: HAD family phosphatase [Bacteroidetes bacterium]|nr:HAD family phosphatase [Bacteroidota bacterium]